MILQDKLQGKKKPTTQKVNSRGPEKGSEGAKTGVVKRFLHELYQRAAVPQGQAALRPRIEDILPAELSQTYRTCVRPEVVDRVHPLAADALVIDALKLQAFRLEVEASQRQARDAMVAHGLVDVKKVDELREGRGDGASFSEAWKLGVPSRRK